MSTTFHTRNGFPVESRCDEAKLGLVRSLFLFFALCWTFSASAAEPVKPTTAAPKSEAKPARLEAYLLQPEPRTMRSTISKTLFKAPRTIFSPAKETATGLELYTAAEFGKLGLSWDTYAERAAAAADRKLASLQPEWIKDEAGKVLYAVYRGEEPIYATLLLAPSLTKVFEKTFGGEIWVVAPDRNSLYVFPANAELVADFAGDLEERFESNPYGASEEIFAFKQGESEPRVVGTFTGR